MASFRHHERSSARAFLRILGWVAALFGLFLVLANALLSARLRSISRGSGVEVEYRIGYTLLPGLVHIEGLQVEDGQTGRYRVIADRVDFRVDVLGLLAGSFRAKDVEARVSSIEAGGYRLDGRMLARAEDVRREPDALLVHTASLQIIAGQLRRVAEPSAHARISGVVEAREIAVSGAGTRASGSLHLGGDDAGAVLDVADLPQAVRFSLEGLEGHAFAIESAIAVQDGDLRLDDVRFAGGAVEARGSFHRAGESYRGTLEVHRGSLVTRITAADDKVNVVTEW